MAPTAKIIVVTGATGTQGAGVLQALEQDNSFRVRALTRNANSPAAKAIAERGVEIVTADLSNKQTLLKAFTGAYGVFLVTEAGFSSPQEEIQQGKNAADAAKEAGVQHLVFSGLMDPRPFKPNLPVDSSSGRQLPHYETKADIKVCYMQEYMESIGLPFTTLYLHAFMENFFKYPGGFFLKGPGGKYFWSNNSGDQKTHWHSNRATGTAVLEAFQNPDKCLNKVFAAKPELVSNSDIAEVVTQVTGTEYSYHFMPDEKARAMPFPGAMAMSNMFEFWRTCEPALQQRDALPTLGQGHSVQEFVKEHKDDFARAFQNAQQVGWFFKGSSSNVM